MYSLAMASFTYDLSKFDKNCTSFSPKLLQKCHIHNTAMVATKLQNTSYTRQPNIALFASCFSLWCITKQDYSYPEETTNIMEYTYCWTIPYFQKKTTRLYIDGLCKTSNSSALAMEFCINILVDVKGNFGIWQTYIYLKSPINFLKLFDLTIVLRRFTLNSTELDWK